MPHTAEVETEAPVPGLGQFLEEHGSDDAAHAAAVLRVRMTQHDRESRSRSRSRRELGFEREAVVGPQLQVTNVAHSEMPTDSHTKASTVASSRQAS